MAIYEPIMNALLAFLRSACLSPAGPFITIQRRFVTWESLMQLTPPLPQPAMMVFDGFGLGGGKTTFEMRGVRGLPIRKIQRTLVIYAQTAGVNTPSGPVDNTTPGGTLFAPLAESVENAFQSAIDREGVVSLGGLVAHCWIEGDSHWITPDLDPGGQGMLTIPVNMIVP